MRLTLTPDVCYGDTRSEIVFCWYPKILQIHGAIKRELVWLEFVELVWEYQSFENKPVKRLFEYRVGVSFKEWIKANSSA